MIGVNFLWHMHQPDYRPARGGLPILPWVRLHAVRGYLDLLAVLEQHPVAHCTVNFSGILLEQLLTYSPERRDVFADLSLREPADFSAAEAGFVLANFFSANALTLIRPQARYWELFQKRERLADEYSFEAMASQFTAQELLDLLVWFNLAWIGFTGRQRADVRQLVAKGENFSADDQQAVLVIHDELLAEVLPRYKALADSGAIELSFTPYHHPILPLLHDLDGEGTPIGDDQLPQFIYPEDAAEQVRRGMEWYARAFGKAPRGAWPAEGAVSDAALATLADAGVEWAATDQQNLPHGHPTHLTPWRWRHAGRELLLFFRDTRLADNVGFVYASWEPKEAAAHLVHNIVALADGAPYEDPVVSVILDGENPWENYPDGGAGFLHALFSALENERSVECVTPSMVIDRDYPSLDRVSSGSWIYGNFDIWTRDHEARQAWWLLEKARADLDEHIEEGAGPSSRPAIASPTAPGGGQGRPPSNLIYDHLLAAEGSDWFWWYGDTFQSDQKPQFDELFRGHLIRAYELAGRAVPEEMFVAIPALGRTDAAISTTRSSAPGAMARGDAAQPAAGEERDLGDWIV